MGRVLASVFTNRCPTRARNACHAGSGAVTTSAWMGFPIRALFEGAVWNTEVLVPPTGFEPDSWALTGEGETRLGLQSGRIRSVDYVAFV